MDWTPPKGTIVGFTVEVDSDKVLKGLLGLPRRQKKAQLESEIKKLLASHRVRKAKDSSGYELAFDDERLPLILADLKKSRKQGLFGLEYVWINEPPPSTSDENAWYSFEWKGPDVKTLQGIAPNSHFKGWLVDGEPHMRLICTHALKRVIEKAGLRGLKWLPLPESHEHDPVRWEEFYPTHFLGKGVDHVLFDGDKEDRMIVKDKMDPDSRGGKGRVYDYQLRDGIKILPQVLHDLCKEASEQFGILTPVPYVKEHLPPTDFAYGQEFPWFFVSPRAKKVLSDTGWFKESQFQPIKVIPRSECFTPILDEVPTIPKPAPRYWPKQYERQLLERAAEIKAIKSGTAEKIISTETELARLMKNVAKSFPWNPASNEPEWSAIAQIIRKKRFLPLAWESIAPQLPIRTSANRASELSKITFEMVVPHWNLQVNDKVRDDDVPSPKDIVFAKDGEGNWFAIRSRISINGRANMVTKWDCKTLTPSRTWKSELHFASWVLKEWVGTQTVVKNVKKKNGDELFEKVKVVATPNPLRTCSQAQQLIKKSFRSDPWPVAQKQSEWASIKRRPLFKQLPKMWQELAPQLPLAVLQGRDEEQRIADFEMVPPQWNRQTYAGGSSDDAPSRKDIVFAYNAFGDWFAVRSPFNESDEKIVITHWDHETLTPAEQWQGVPHFVSWIIERWKESKPADD